MSRTIEAIYEDGILRPLEPLDLQDHERVRVTLSSPASMPAELAWYMTQPEWEAAMANDTTLEQVREALSSIPGNLSDTIREERDSTY